MKRIRIAAHFRGATEVPSGEPAQINRSATPYASRERPAWTRAQLLKRRKRDAFGQRVDALVADALARAAPAPGEPWRAPRAHREVATRRR